MFEDFDFCLNVSSLYCLFNVLFIYLSMRSGTVYIYYKTGGILIVGSEKTLVRIQ